MRSLFFRIPLLRLYFDMKPSVKAVVKPLCFDSRAKLTPNLVISPPEWTWFHSNYLSLGTYVHFIFRTSLRWTECKCPDESLRERERHPRQKSRPFPLRMLPQLILVSNHQGIPALSLVDNTALAALLSNLLHRANLIHLQLPWGFVSGQRSACLVA